MSDSRGLFDRLVIRRNFAVSHCQSLDASVRRREFFLYGTPYQMSRLIDENGQHSKVAFELHQSHAGSTAAAAIRLVIAVEICDQIWPWTFRRSEGATGKRIVSLRVN